MANLRRSIYIGIGGAGVKAIAHTKKMFEDAFGEGNIPEAIQFLAIDSDFADLYDSLHPVGMSECAVRVKSDVRLSEVYTLQNHLGRINWMFPENVRLISPRLGLGAGQVRTNGRLFIELCMSEVLDGIRNRYDRVMSAPINHWGSVDIHIVCSLAGGTGSGAFIPLACMIRNMYGDGVNIFGYGLMDGVFRAMDVARTQTSNVRINTYAAVLDLDYFQSATVSQPVKVSIAGHDIVITAPLFDRYFLWDNNSENGFVLTSLDELCRMMASAMYIYGAEAGTEIAARLHAYDWRYGTYNIYDKMGWVHRMNVCEMVYDGEFVADMYAHEAKRVLVDLLLTCGEVDGSDMAKKWLEMTGVRDAELECGKLLDSICSPAVMSGLCEVGLDIHDSYDEVSKKVKQYVEYFQSPIDGEAVASLCDDLRGSLWEAVSASMNMQGGVQEVGSFLGTLWCVFALFSDELRCQITDLTTHIQHAGKVQLADAFQEYRKYCSYIFRRRSVQQEILDEIAKISKNILDLKVEVFRREEAIEIFKILKGEVKLALAKVEEIHKALREIFHKCDEKLSRGYSSHIQSVMTFDVSLKEVSKFAIGVDDVSVDDFLVSLMTPVMDMTCEDLSTALDKYCVSLPRYEEYRSKSFKDVINGLTDEECEHVKWSVSDRICPFLKLNGRGEINVLRGSPPVDAMVSNHAAVIYNLEAVQNLGSVLRCMPSDAWRDTVVVSTESDYHRQKMMLCRIDAAIIPYCVDTLDLSMQHEYEAHIAGARYNPHIDLHIYEDMKRKDFKLKPERHEAMFYWVCGQIFGWPGAQCETAEVGYPEKYICYMHQRYMFWIPNLLQGGGWQELKSSNRARAFEYFKTELLPYLRDYYDELISRKIAERGLIYYRHLIDSLRSGGKQRYVETVLRETPRMPMEDYVSFIDEEWTYIEEKLVEELQLTKL